MSEINIEDSNISPLQTVVQHIIFEPNLKKKLEALDVVLNSLNEEEYKNVNAKSFRVFLDSIFSDRMFMRKLTYISQLKDIPELSLEYNGIDYISTQEYNYNERFENRVSKIKKEVHKFLGSLLKEFNKGFSLNI